VSQALICYEHRMLSRILVATSKFFCVTFVLMAQTLAHSAPPPERDLTVRIQKHGAAITVDVELTVQATAEEVWDVLTDYDHMAEIVSNVESSKVLKRAGNRLEITQKSRTTLGPLHFSFDNVREVELTPYTEIRSRLISGDMDASAFTTRIVSEGKATRIFNHGEFIPNLWMPPLIGRAFLEAETRKQFEEMRAEILRRKTNLRRRSKRKAQRRN